MCTLNQHYNDYHAEIHVRIVLQVFNWNDKGI